MSPSFNSPETILPLISETMLSITVVRSNGFRAPAPATWPRERFGSPGWLGVSDKAFTPIWRMAAEDT